MKIYTRTGDDGNTGLQGGSRISKSHTRIAAYGAVDEANAALGVAIASWKDCPDDITVVLTNIQNNLFAVGADLSNPNLIDVRNRVTPSMVDELESIIDRFESELAALANFILPGGSIGASHIHLVRTIVRRAESLTVRLSDTDEINAHCIIYLNRLSDLLFVVARVANSRDGCKETVWRSEPSMDSSTGKDG